MNLQEMQTAIVNLMLGTDLDPGEMNVWINDAVGDLSSTMKIKKTATITLQPNVSTYTLPTDVLHIVKLETPSTNGSNPLDLPVRPYAMSIWGDTITLEPAPRAEGTARLYYYAYPARLTQGTDSPPFPSQYHQAVVYYAVAQAKRKYMQMGDAEVYDGLYFNSKRELQKAVAMMEGPQFIQPDYWGR